MIFYWLNNSCSLFSSLNSLCTLSNIASYTIDINSAATVIAELKFAQEWKIKLLIKNTDHDYIQRLNDRDSLTL